MREIKYPRSGWLLLCGLALSFSIGCGGGTSLPSAADPAVARKSLQTMLDSWRRGDSAEQLKALKPSIVAIDDDWKAGLLLAKYQVKEPDVPHGTAVQTRVLLSLQDGSGKAIEKEACYVIGTSPKITIARSDREDEDVPTKAGTTAASPTPRNDDRDRD